MDKKLIELKDGGKKTEASAFLNNISEKELKSLIDQRAVKGRGDPGVLIRAIFYGSAPGSEGAGTRRMVVFKHCIKRLQSGELSSKVATDMIGILLLETDAFPASCLIELVDIFVDAIKNGTGTAGKALELFPKLLSALAAQDVVNVASGQTTGPEYKSLILNNLTAGRWDASTVIHLATMFRDVPLTTEELKFIIVKMIRMFPEIDLQGLPPLIYQMLLLSTKGHKKLVLEGVTSFFVNRDKLVKKKTAETDESELLVEEEDDADQLRHVEGTIILHVTFAIKQDQDLGRELMKYLKAHQQSNAAAVLAPFNVALALSIARIHRFEDQVLDLLKSTVLRSFKDAEKQSGSQWVREMVPESCDVAHILLDTVKNSIYGWDHVSQGLVELGFSLMDSFGPKGVFGKVVADTSCGFHKTPNQRACQLGASILQEIFKVQEMVRADILQQILNRVVTKATTPVSHYIELLSSTVRSAPQILLESLPKIREAFDYLSYLPAPTAAGLLTAVQPLMKLSMSLKDGLMLTLRKAMFSRHLGSREIAVSGFLMLLSRFRILGGLPMSQCSQSFSGSQFSSTSVNVHQPYNASMNEAVCLEILGSLRRTLSQKADVRLVLYEGLFDVLCQNSKLQTPIMTLLLKQFGTYYEEKVDLQPPVKLDACIITQGEEVSVGEPLAHLVVCLVQCYLKSHAERQLEERDDDEDEALHEAEEILESLTRRLIKSQLEDFELDRNADFSINTAVGRRNNIFTLLASGCYEAVMEYNFRISKLEPACMQNVLQLYAGYHRLAELMKDKMAGGAGKRGRGAGTGQKSLLSLQCVAAMLAALYSDVPAEHQEGADMLQSNLDFGRFVLAVCLEKLRQVEERGHCEGAHGQDRGKLFSYCTEIAKITCRYYTADMETPENGRRDRAKVAALCLDMLATCINIICLRFTDRLPEFLQQLDSADAEISDEDEVHKYIKKFQRLAISVLTTKDDDRSIKEAVPLFNMIDRLSRSLSDGGTQISQVQIWAQNLAVERDVEDTGVTKSLLSLLFGLTARHTNITPFLRALGHDIHRTLGDIEQDVELTGEAHNALVTVRTAAPTILLALLTQADHELDDTDWVIVRLKAELTLPQTQTDEGPSSTQRECCEKSICSKLGNVVNMCHELLQSAVPVGTCIDTLIRFVTRLYTTLTQLVKYHLALYTLGSGSMTGRFEKLVRLSGTNVTQYAYAMITYAGALQSEHHHQTTEKRKKKDRSNLAAVAAVSKAKVLKETKVIPDLIFAIEQYERFLIQLSKKSKVDLMEHMKLSTSRDFRINIVQLTAALDEQDSDSGSDSGTNDGNTSDVTENPLEVSGSASDQDVSDTENEPPPNKKAKTETQPRKSKLAMKQTGKARSK